MSFDLTLWQEILSRPEQPQMRIYFICRETLLSINIPIAIRCLVVKKLPDDYASISLDGWWYTVIYIAAIVTNKDLWQSVIHREL